MYAYRGASMRKQFVLDKRTNQLLEELASYRGGNRSQVIREAIQVFADMEERLDRMEAGADFQGMMARSEADIRAGRVIAHEEVVQRSRAKVRKDRKR